MSSIDCPNCGHYMMCVDVRPGRSTELWQCQDKSCNNCVAVRDDGTISTDGSESQKEFSDF